MDLQEKVYAICWLDSGKFHADAVAEKFNVTAQCLEEELASFKKQSLYYDKIIDYVISEASNSVASNPFSIWNDSYTVRTLRNNRIEFIMVQHGETRKADKLYHIIIPDKQWLDNIRFNSRWLTRSEFNRELVANDNCIWENQTLEWQLSFLTLRFDNEVFEPFSNRIGMDIYKKLTGRNYLDRTEWKMDDQLRNMQDKGAEQKTHSVPSLPEQHGFPDKDYEIYRKKKIEYSINLIQKREVPYMDGSNQKIFSPSPGDWEQLDKLNSEENTDSMRLENLAKNGPDSIEKQIAYKIDPFYDFYGLKEAFLKGTKDDDFEPVRILATRKLEELAEKKGLVEERKNNVSFSYNEKQWNSCKERINELFQEMLDAAGDDKITGCVESLCKILKRKNEEFVDEMERMYTCQFEKKANETMKKQVSGLFRKIRGQEKAENEDKQASGETDSGETDGITLSLQEKRSKILAGLKDNVHDVTLIEELAQTEKMILQMPPDKRPSFYPETDRILFDLYMAEKVPTELVVKRLLNKKLLNN